MGQQNSLIIKMFRFRIGFQKKSHHRHHLLFLHHKSDHHTLTFNIDRLANQGGIFFNEVTTDHRKLNKKLVVKENTPS